MEEKIPLSISKLSYDKAQIQPIFATSGSGGSKSKCIIGTDIFNDEQKKVFTKTFKEHVGENSSVADKLIKGKWEKVWEDANPKFGKFKEFAAAAEDKQYTIHLIQCTHNGVPTVFGGFAHSKIPHISSNMQSHTHYIPTDLSNFVFQYKEGDETHFKLTNNKQFGYVYTDYQQGGALSVAGDFFLCSWSYDYTHACGNIYDMQSLEGKAATSYYANIQITKYEMWHCDIDAKNSPDADEYGGFADNPYYM